MSEYNPTHESLNILLEQLEKMHVHLQSNLSHFVTQIKLKAKNWMDKMSDTEMAFKDVVAMVTSANATLIEHLDIIAEYNIQSTTTVVQHKTPGLTDTKESQTDLLNRVKLVEKAIVSLQETKQKTEYDVSELKQWRETLVTEQCDWTTKIEQLSKKQKQNFKNLRKQMSEQDNKVKELNKEIECLKEKDAKSNKTLEIMSLDMKKYENSLQKINSEMQVYTDNSKIMADTSNRIDKLQLKHSVVYKLLEQRLMPFDKMIQMFNQRFENREQHLKKLEVIESEIKRLSRDIHTIDTRDCNRYACHIQLKGDTAVSRGSIVSRFGDVREYNSQNFNQTTGTFVSPHDGLYLVCVTLHEWEDKLIRVGIWARDMWYNVIEVKSAHTSAAGSVVVDMKKGQELYFYVDGADQDAKLSCFSSFAIVSLFK